MKYMNNIFREQRGLKVREQQKQELSVRYCWSADRKTY